MIYRGRTDSRLSESGWQQMQVAVDSLNMEWQHIVSSPLNRCRLFAETIAEQRQLPIKLLEGFQELDFGRWDGCEIASVWEQEPENAERFYQFPHEAPHGGESILELQQRVVTAWQRLIEQHKGERLLLIQHGGTIRVLLADILRIPLDNIASLDVPYACISRIKLFHHDDNRQAVLQFHNLNAE
jgi:broad specificity phosphatase PhoE